MAGGGAVTWVAPPPANVAPGATFTVSWNVSGGSTTHTDVHWDTVTPPTAFFSPAQSGGAGTYTEVLTAPASPGTWYYQAHALVGGSDFQSAAFAVTAVSNPPANDNFPGEVLSGFPASTTGTNVGATVESGEPDPDGGFGARSVWWSWTAPSSGPVTVSTAGSDFDTTLGVYRGSAVDALSVVAENDDTATDVTSEVTFAATAGTTYKIQVNGFFGDSGNIVLSVAPAAPSGGGGGGGGGGGRCGSVGLDLMIPLAFLWLGRTRGKSRAR